MTNIFKSILIILFAFTITYAQKDIVFEQISVPQGLSNPEVFSVLQDKFGYMWFGTRDGLNRYDGYTFKIFRNEIDKENSISDNFPFFLYEDKMGTFWIGTSRGLNKYNPDDESFTRFNPDTIENAPENQFIYSIFEDSRNRFWLGTNRGIYIFDRETDTSDLQLVLGDSVEKESTSMYSLVFETNARKIITSSAIYGLMQFDEQEKIFKPLPMEENMISNFQNGWTLGHYEDSDGMIWLIAQKGFFKYNPEAESVTKIDILKNVAGLNSDNVYTNIMEADSSHIWITTSAGLFLYDRITADFRRYNYDPESPNGLMTNMFFNLYCDQSGVMWFATFAGMHKFDPDKDPFNKFQPTKSNADEQGSHKITAFARSGKGDHLIWAGSLNDGFYQFDNENKKFLNFSHNPDIPKSLSSNRVSSIYEDSLGILWIGTFNKGLNRFNPKTNKFKQYLFEESDISSISSSNILSVTGGKDNDLWIGTNRGLNKLDTKSGKFERIPTIVRQKYPDELVQILNRIRSKKREAGKIIQVGNDQDIRSNIEIKQPGEYLVISYGEGLPQWNMVDYGWIEDENGDTLWAMNEYSKSHYAGGNTKNRVFMGIMNLTKNNYTLRYISDDSHAYNSWNETMFPDSTFWGIQIYPINQNDARIFKTYFNSQKNAVLADYQLVNNIHYSQDGIIWLATERGIVKYNPENKQSYQIEVDKENIQSVTNILRDIYLDNEGIVWCASDGGLIRYDPISDKILLFTQQDGLPSTFLKGILEDDHQNLWVSSMAGIFRIEKPNSDGDLSLLTYDVKDGLQGYEFSEAATLKSTTGQLYFGGKHGFNVFYPGKINKQPPEIVISDFLVSNEVITPGTQDSPLEKSILMTKHMTLSYDQNDISFEFAPLHYTRPDRNQTAYMLEGYNKNWIFDNRRYASFTNLDPGKYTFLVKGANSDGVWNDNPASIQITVLPPWWATIWAYILYGLLFVASLFAFDRVQRVRLTQRTKMKEAELRAQAAEANSRAIQAENERKTHELEEARNLQLSMLPKELPQLPHLDIAVYMKTATEVGGDYYDFHVSLDGTLTVVVGDATGHGLKAGTMVTAAKSLFSTHAANPDILYTFNEITRCLKHMDMKMLAMCLSILKIKKNEITLSSAGMPPALIYRNEKKSIKEIEIKGMPLGTFQEFPYQLENTVLNPGDTLLLYSDGLPELFNEQKEMFGYERVIDVFKEVAAKPAEDIIEHLKNAGSDWVNESPPDDDVTFVVIKAKS